MKLRNPKAPIRNDRKAQRSFHKMLSLKAQAKLALTIQDRLELGLLSNNFIRKKLQFVDGYCYLKFLRCAERKTAARNLGSDPSLGLMKRKLVPSQYHSWQSNYTLLVTKSSKLTFAHVNRALGGQKLAEVPANCCIGSTICPFLSVPGDHSSYLVNQLPYMNGYCYLKLIRRTCRFNAVVTLGPWPLATDFFDYIIHRNLNKDLGLFKCNLENTINGSFCHIVEADPGSQNCIFPLPQDCRIGGSISEVVKTLGPDKEMIERDAVTEIKKEIAIVRKYNPYHHSSKQQSALESYGIGSDPYAVRSHTHAAEKAIENKLLDIVGMNLRRRSVITMLWQKRNKAHLMGRSNCKDVYVNTIMEAKDLVRYDQFSFGLPSVATSTAFIGDALHHMTPESVFDLFERSPNLMVLHATIVIPPETLLKCRSSNPELYSLRYYDDKFVYIPEGHAGGSYVHEVKNSNWLAISHIQRGGKFLTVKRLETLAAHHYFVIVKGKVETDSIRVFQSPSQVELLDIFADRQSNVRCSLDHAFAIKMERYVHSLKRLELADVTAKTRQLLSSEELLQYSPTDLVKIDNYFYFLAHTSRFNSSEELIGSGFFESLVSPLKQWFSEICEKFLGKSNFHKTLEALEWKVINYDVKTVIYDMSKPWEKLHWKSENNLLSFDLDSNDNPTSLVDNTDCEASYSESTKFDYELVQVEDDFIDIRIPGIDIPIYDSEYLASEEPVEVEESPIPEVLPEIEDNLSDSMSIDGWMSQSLKTFLPEHDDKVLSILEKFGVSKYGQVVGKNLILPITDFKSVQFEKIGQDEFTESLQDRGFGFVSYTPDAERVAVAATDLEHGQGVLITSDEAGELFKKAMPMSVYTCVILGAGGAGKTTFVEKFVKDNPKSFTVVTPLSVLKKEWQRKGAKNVFTYETALKRSLKKPANEYVILDDFTRFPAGWIELYMSLNTKSKYIVIGDSRQADSHSMSGAFANALVPAIDLFAPLSPFYLNWTWRMTRPVANALGHVSWKLPESGKPILSVSSEVPKDCVVLAPSTTLKVGVETVNDKAFTYTSAQGATFDKVAILIDDNITRVCGDKAVYTALSRSKGEIVFVSTVTGPDTFEKVKCTPFLRTFVELVREYELNQPKVREPEEDFVDDVTPVTSQPKVSEEFLIEELNKNSVEKFDREIFRADLGHTDAVKEIGRVTEQIPRQQRSDEALNLVTLDKRVHHATVEENLDELARKKALGNILWTNFKEQYYSGLESVMVDQDLLVSCRAEITKTYLSKTEALLKGGQLRQSPDFDKFKIADFLKTQWVRKTEKYGLPIKAGQTVTSFMQETVMATGTLSRYMRRMFDKLCTNPNVYLHREKTEQDFSTWVKNGWNFSGHATINDCEAFDASQDGAFVEFERLHAEFLGVPRELIDFYVDTKIKSYIWRGTISVMRLSGEGPTYDFNTWANMAFMATKYSIPSVAMTAYSGDDFACDQVLSVKPAFKELECRFKLKEKRFLKSQGRGSYADFCGMIITPNGVIKNPRKLYLSLKSHDEIGTIDKAIVNYYNDLRTLISLGDNIFSALDATETEFFAGCLNVVHDYILRGSNYEGHQNLTLFKKPRTIKWRVERDETRDCLIHMIIQDRKFIRNLLEGVEQTCDNKPNSNLIFRGMTNGYQKRAKFNQLLNRQDEYLDKVLHKSAGQNALRRLTATLDDTQDSTVAEQSAV
ncbi:polyprotein [Sclerotinia sclerotiorum debilitation-associated RNA virus]|uniref:RNA replication protein n=1 Tax=Sclerotinia sclerotiorum debilitation-associated virus (isolate Sclerotinia/China/Xie/-) TaxID=686987 RepID=RDRP_SSDRV|nr:polyprotein [Sclerotinia sclerotiorum debilitation-associated RNA virus]Q6YI57.2 RecName: Full=RNA replication protein; Includes: RecName: Full=RNA-directed RNA polymerase; Includes: RecName: Full=Helicase [Sclerotinia sclerotiorum debilitation-associated virus CHN/Xie]AAN64332.2 polyprotein [Sclerotinia sclerotiorum debilitation-associated RNA virus]